MPATVSFPWKFGLDDRGLGSCGKFHPTMTKSIVRGEGDTRPSPRRAMLTTMLTTCLFALLAAEATALKFTWFQTEGTLELDLKVQCSGPVELKMQCTAPSLDLCKEDQSDRFSFSCTTAGGETAALAFELREPVITPSRCWSAVRGTVHCSLTKHHSHAYDRLAAQPNEIKGVGKIDYAKWVELDHPEPNEFTDLYTDSPHVQMLDAAALRAAREAHEVVVLDVYYPWCTSCESKRRPFAAAAEAASSLPGSFFFGAVDVLEQADLRAELGANCHWDCTHLVLRRGEAAARVMARGDWESHKLLQELNAYAQPALKDVPDVSQPGARNLGRAADSGLSA